MFLPAPAYSFLQDFSLFLRIPLSLFSELVLLDRTQPNFLTALCSVHTCGPRPTLSCLRCFLSQTQQSNVWLVAVWSHTSVSMLTLFTLIGLFDFVLFRLYFRISFQTMGINLVKGQILCGRKTHSETRI